DVQDSARGRQLSDRLRMFEIIICAHHEEVPINGAIPRRAPLSGGAPVAKSVPKHESYEGVVDFMDEPPEPVRPERLEGIDGRTSDQRPAAAEISTDPAQDFVRRFDVDPAILIEREAGIDPVAIRLVPDAPVPFSDGLAPPLFDGIPC